MISNSTSSHFDPEAFLQPFYGREHLLDEYLDSIPAAGVTIARPIAVAGDFRDHLGVCPADEHRILTAGLVEAWEMASDDGHEQLLAVMRLAGSCNGGHTNLPAECLALHLLSTNRDLFESALSLEQVRKCDALEMFQPDGPVQLVADLNAATNHFRGEMAVRCGEKYGSRRILLRRFDDPEIFTVGFYFEKPPKAKRSLSGSEADPHLSRDEERPLQFDAVMFEPSTGVLSVKSGWGRLTEPIRRAFAAAYLGNPNAYEWVGASRILHLSEFISDEDELVDFDGSVPVIRDLEYAPNQDEFSAKYRITGSNVLEIIRRDENVEMVQDSHIRRLIVQMALEGSARRRRVVLTAPNKVDFKRGTEAGRIIAQLRDWNVLQAPTPSAVAA